MKLKIRDITSDEARDCYIKVATELKMPDVPFEYVELAAMCVKAVVARLCEKNGLELMKNEE